MINLLFFFTNKNWEVIIIAKHINYEERLEIEMSLKSGLSVSEISKKLKRHKSTISREIRLRAVVKKTGCNGRNYNPCIYRYECKITGLCNENICNKKSGKRYIYCRYCANCFENCELFVEEYCEKLKKPPYVCNGCQTRDTCTLTKKYYEAKCAELSYETLLKESRKGIEKTPEEIKRIDEIIKPLIIKGHSIHHIIANNKDIIMTSERTIYNYIEAGVFSVKNMDLPRRVRYRPRKRTKQIYKVDKKCLEGRRYNDYLKFIDENKDITIVQMDTVEGIKGGKVLLTIHFIDTSFMIIFLRDTNDSKSVTECFNRIYKITGENEFKKLFNILLTDNGSEFSNPESIERIAGNERLTRIFYCYPYSPYLKPEVENNHTLIRRIIPKGKSMDNLTQEKVTIIMSHINSYTRKKLNDQSPYDVFSQRYGYNLIKSLGIERIEPNDIILKPNLV